MRERITQFSFEHPPITFGKVWLHLHRLGVPLYMDAYFKTWGFQNTQNYFTDYYPVKGDFEDLYLFFKEGNWYGKYNIKYFGYVMLDYFIDKNHFNEYLEKKGVLKKEIEELWHSYIKEDISKLNSEEQILLANNCLALMVRSFVVDPFAPMIGEMAPDYTNWWLDKKGVPKEEQKDAFHLLFASDEVSETIRRQLFVKDKIDSASEEERGSIVKKLAQDFAFAKTEFSGYLPYTEADVLGEYNSIKQIELKTDEEKKEKEELLNRLNATEQEKFIFYLFGYCQYSRDERKEYLQKLMTIADWCLEGLSKTYSIDINWLRACLIGELSKDNLENPDFIKIIKERYENGIAMYWANGGEGGYVEGEDGWNIYNSIDNKENEIPGEIKGQPTYYGKVSGMVKIINDPKTEVPTEPFVLVTGMTSPDFIHFMQKCVAIVTDEGGITSHAAILSRELKKPCIVGTKIARKVLKDGDMVEVDANSGIVKIL